MSTLALRFLAAAALTLASAAALASPLQLGFVLEGVGHSTSGILTLNATSTPGTYLVSDVSGYENGVRIDGALAPGAYGLNDNTFRPAGSPPVSVSGLGYTAGGQNFNLYNDLGALGSPVGMGLCGSATSGSCVSVTQGARVNSFVFGEIHRFAFEFGGAGFAVHGVFSAIATGLPGAFQVLDIMGDQNGTVIDDLLAVGSYGFNDNRLWTTGPAPASVFGIAFTAGGRNFNLYYDMGALGSPVNLGFCDSAFSGNCASVTQGLAVTSFSMRELPEPGTAWLAILPLLMSVGAMRRLRPTA